MLKFQWNHPKTLKFRQDFLPFKNKWYTIATPTGDWIGFYSTPDIEIAKEAGYEIEIFTVITPGGIKYF